MSVSTFEEAEGAGILASSHAILSGPGLPGLPDGVLPLRAQGEAR